MRRARGPRPYEPFFVNEKRLFRNGISCQLSVRIVPQLCQLSANASVNIRLQPVLFYSKMSKNATEVT